jgi:hypothetical protein
MLSSNGMGLAPQFAVHVPPLGLGHRLMQSTAALHVASFSQARRSAQQLDSSHDWHRVSPAYTRTDPVHAPVVPPVPVVPPAPVAPPVPAGDVVQRPFTQTLAGQPKQSVCGQSPVVLHSVPMPPVFDTPALPDAPPELVAPPPSRMTPVPPPSVPHAATSSTHPVNPQRNRRISWILAGKDAGVERLLRA